jgi:predicted metal-dependent peptidase
MDQEMLDKAKRKMDTVVFSLWRKDNVLFGALSMLDKIPDPKFDTMGIDTSSNDRVSLRYNPNFVLSISLERLELVLAIEGFRVLLRHCTTRLREPGNIAHLASSLAIDQLMNSDLEKLLQGLDEVMPDPKRFGLPDNQAYEEYYRSLLDKQEKAEQMIQQIWNSMSQEEKEKAIQQAMGGEGDGYKDFENEQEAMKEYSNPNGNANQRWGKNNGFDADVKAYIDKVKSKTRMWGKYTGTAQGQILAAIEPKVSASDVIRKFGASVLTGKSISSRMRLNRRWDIERPGYRRVYMPHVIFAVDSSGTMTDEDLAYGFGVVNKLLHYCKITFVEFDTEIKIVEKNFRKARKSFTCLGRGGTAYKPVFDFAEKNKCDGLIIYSDGYAEPISKPKFRVLWLMSQKDQKPPVDFGYVIWLDRLSDDRI